MVRPFFAAGALVAAATLAACADSGAAETGPAVARDFRVDAFTAIESAGPFDVEVTTGGAVAVRASAPQDLLDRLEVRVEQGVLKIGMKRGPAGWSMSRGQSIVSVSVPSLARVASAGSGEIKVDRVRGERFEASLAGSGDLELGSVDVAALNLRVAGSGSASARGAARQLEASLAGSGDLDLGELTAATARIAVAGSGSARARVTGTADLNTVGSGDIEVEGGARCNSRRLGSGSIRCS